ncbi:MAG: SDR family NAD(P)-dependent oxidoreductase [Planctomycetota bacterium]
MLLKRAVDFTEKYGPWALITGASAGLGACYARQLAAKGLHLILVARRGDRLEQLAAALRDQCQVEVRCLALDLLSDDAVEGILQATPDVEIGLFVNNAGFGWKGEFLDAEPQRLREMVRLNCEVVTLLSHALLPAMVARKRGGLIVLASAAAYQPTPYMGVYGATKGFDLLLSESLSVEMRGYGVDVLAVSPGTTDTEFHQVAGGVATFDNMADPEHVVSQSLRLLGRRYSFIHGWHNRFLCFLNRLAPRGLAARVSGKVIRSYTVGPE